MEFRCRLASPSGEITEGIYVAESESRLRHELGQRGREFVEANYAKPRILGHLVDRLDAIVAAK